MSEAGRTDGPEQAALVELWRTLNLIAAELRQSHNSIPTTWKQAEWITRNWSCVFHSCGTLAGCVESWLMPNGLGKAAIGFEDFCRVRRMALIGVDLLPADQWNVVGLDYDDADWEARAREAGLNLPRLMRPEKYGTNGYAKLEADSQWFGAHEPSEDGVEINEASTPDVRFIGLRPVENVVSQEDGRHAHHSLAVSEFAEDVARELESLARLQELASAAEVAVKSLPRVILNELNASTENGWKGRLIRDVVEPLYCWRIPGRDSPRPIPTTAEQFVECFAEHNPIRERESIEAAALRYAGELAREYSTVQPPQMLAPARAAQPTAAIEKAELLDGGNRLANGSIDDSSPPLKDGPVAHGVWAHGGEAFDGMPNLPFRFAKLLYGDGKLPRTKTTTDIVDEVQGRESQSTADTVKNWQGDATDFFKRNRIPLTIVKAGETFTMKNITES